MRFLIESQSHELRWASESETVRIENGFNPSGWTHVTMSIRDYEEMLNQIAALERRVQGMREAVSRWRQRAGVDPPTETWNLIRVERVLRRDEWVVLHTYEIPLDPSPGLLAEAWALVAECTVSGCGHENCTKVLFDGKRWTATFVPEQKT